MITVRWILNLTLVSFLSRASINKLIAQQFPLKSTEFPQGSPQFNEYISAIDKVVLLLLRFCLALNKCTVCVYLRNYAGQMESAVFLFFAPSYTLL